MIVAAPNAATFTAASNFAAAVNVTGGSLNLNGRTLSVARDFVTSGGGNLVMTSPTGTLNVVGNSTFGGANELGSMTAGTITVGGNLTQLASNSPDSYHPSGTHITTFNGVNQTISFATPGLVPGSSHLQEAVWSGSGTLSLATAVNAHGTFSILTSNATTIAGANQLLTVGGFNSSVNPTVFNGVQLRIDQATPTTLNVSNLSFINQSSTAIQLQISHPGAAAPTTLTNLTFSSVPSTGFYLSAIDLNPGNGLPFTIDMVNPNPVTPGGFVQTVGGAVVNWPGGPVPATWTGAVSTNWNTAGNWNTGVVPGTTTDAVIPSGTPNQPVTLSNPSNVQSLTVNGQLDMNGFNLIVHGNLLGTGLMVNSGVVANLIMQVGGTSLALPTIPNLRSTGGTVTLTGNVIVSGNVAVAATGGLDLGGKSMTVGGNLSVAGAGATLVMTSQTGILNVVGTVTFDGADETGKLTSGVLAAGGDFQVLNTNSAKAFVATGLHETIFSNATGPQNISMVNPGLSGNHFGNVALNTPGDFTLLNAPMFVESSFNSPGAGSVVHGNGFRIQASSADIQGLTLDNAPLQIVGTTTPPGLIIDDVTFNNMSTAVDQLEVILPGAPSSYAFNNLVFNTVPVNGKYLFANDNTADANPLTIDMVNPTPATDGGFTSTAGGAVINWPGVGGGQAVWTGLSDTDWNNPGNWQANQVPAAGSDVFMAAGAPNYPALISNEVVGNMEVQSGAVVDFVDATLQVTGSLVGNGSMTNGGPEMSGSGVELEMADLGSLLITGNVTLISDLDITSGGVLITGVPANLTVDAFALTMTGDLTLQNSGTMVMANPAGSVSVGGNALFDGGPENGLLTQGFLHVQGNFTQANSSTTSSFRTGPSFQTAFDGSSPQTIVMADSLNSFFSNLTLANNVTAGSMVLVQANLNVGNGVSVTATDLSFVGTGFDVRGGVTTAAGSLLQLGRLYVAGAMSIGGTYNTTSIIYTGSGQTAPSNLPYQFLYSTGTVTLAAGNATIGTLTTQGGTLTLGGRTTVNDVFLQTGTLKPNNHTLVVIGALQTLSTGTLTMQNALDSVLVTGLGAFGGGSTAGLMTDGVLKIGGSFAQTSGTSSLSFAPSGAHLTLLGAGGVRVVTFVSPGTGAGGSHFANLDVTAATGGLNLTSNIVADGALIAQPTGTAPTLTGGGKSVTALSLSVTAASTSLVLDNAPLIVNEQGTIRAQQFDRAVFQGFPTGATSTILMDMTMVGTNVTPRPVTFTAPTVQTSLGAGGLYARLVSSNGPQSVTVTISGSNDPTGGPSRSNPSFGTTVNGARIVWQ
ncbi:MAG: hypothetical protein ABI836_04580 [Gemmatimonadota bacterium]